MGIDEFVLNLIKGLNRFLLDSAGKLEGTGLAWELEHEGLAGVLGETGLEGEESLRGAETHHPIRLEGVSETCRVKSRNRTKGWGRGGATRCRRMGRGRKGRKREKEGREGDRRGLVMNERWKEAYTGAFRREELGGSQEGSVAQDGLDEEAKVFFGQPWRDPKEAEGVVGDPDRQGRFHHADLNFWEGRVSRRRYKRRRIEENSGGGRKELEKEALYNLRLRGSSLTKSKSQHGTRNEKQNG